MSSQMLKGKLALVTGGGSGIGRATCHILAREGATVIASDINGPAAQETINTLIDPCTHMALTTDVSKSDSVDAAIASVIAKYQTPPTLLVNCAGINLDAPLKSLEEADATRVIDVNLKGTIFMCKAVAKAMEKHGLKEGSFVNISSNTGTQGRLNRSVYSATKGAIIAFTKAIAKELIRDGIRVNNVLPGPIDTGMVQNISEAKPELVDQMKEMILKSYMGRRGQPEEVGEVIAFLLSDRSSFMVGSCVEVDGLFVSP